MRDGGWRQNQERQKDPEIKHQQVTSRKNALNSISVHALQDLLSLNCLDHLISGCVPRNQTQCLKAANKTEQLRKPNLMQLAEVPNLRVGRRETDSMKLSIESRQSPLGANEELRGDREIVMQAVTQHGYSLQSASEELRSDQEIVLKAVSHDWRAIQYATEDRHKIEQGCK